MNKTRLSGFQIIIYGIDGDGARGRGVEGGWRGKGKSITFSKEGLELPRYYTLEQGNKQAAPNDPKISIFLVLLVCFLRLDF